MKARGCVEFRIEGLRVWVFWAFRVVRDVRVLAVGSSGFRGSGFRVRGVSCR